MQGSQTSLSTLSSVNWCTTGARLAWPEKLTQFLINKYGKPLFFIEYFFEHWLLGLLIDTLGQMFVIPKILNNMRSCLKY